jgi:uncharacterized protein YukE
MADDIRIDPDRLRSHAARVEQVAGDVAMAKDAAGSINLGGGAFGLMCAFLVPPISIVSSVAQSTLSAAGSMVQRSAREVRGVAGDFEANEDDIEQQISSLRSQLGG